MDDRRESGPARAVEAHLSALRARDLEALRATVSERLSVQLDDPAFTARLEVMSHLVPDEYAVTAASEEGDRATLDVETDRQAGRFELVRESGAWRVAGQSWKTREARTSSS